MQRKKHSHKGENGRVLIIGGNELYHGAPILAALGAEKSGVDLVYMMVPCNQQYLARQFSMNVIVDRFSGYFLRSKDTAKIITAAKKACVLVLGNGLGERAQTVRACRKIIIGSSCSLVLDATALQAFMQLKNIDFMSRDLVLTPHKGEFSRMLGHDLDKITEKDLKDLVKKQSKKWRVTIVLKGYNDIIASATGETYINTSGHPIMTKGGTGDILAGLIAGLMAQGLSGFEAAKKATKHWGDAGEYIAKKKGLMVTIEEILEGL